MRALNAMSGAKQYPALNTKKELLAAALLAASRPPPPRQRYLYRWESCYNKAWPCKHADSCTYGSECIGKALSEGRL